MGSRLGFVVSLLAACGIHAVILLVPRVAVVAAMPIPTIELDLAAPAASTAAVPAVAKRVAPTVAAIVENVTHHEAPAPSPSVPLEPAVEASVAGQSDSSVAVAEPLGRQADPIAGHAPSATSSADPPPVVGGSGTPGALPTSAAAVAAPVLISPRPQSEILPAYPRSARRAGLEGVVKINALVDASGVVTSAEVLVSSGHTALDQAALEAVRRALFAPALQEGRRVPCRIVIPIRFQLRAQAP